tara:strand:- start:35 stop:400 length:366 start_codon:yes stop_codon:yes gene_type:complete
MKPTQEQILSALNKLVRENKTELKAEKIELGLVDDIQAMDKEITREYNSFDKKFTEFYKIKRVLVNKLGEFEKLEKSQNKRIDAAKKAFKDLGVDAKPLFVYESNMRDINSLVKEVRAKLS